VVDKSRRENANLPVRRRDFFKAAALVAASAVPPSRSLPTPRDRINIGVVGLGGRGEDHYRAFVRLPNVLIAYVGDVDERLFPGAVPEIEDVGGYKPTPKTDVRKLLEKNDLDAISIAAPDHWHALMTGACQAGKDVYVEKPVCRNIHEGRKMVEATRSYGRIVRCGLQRRSDIQNQAAVRFVQKVKFGPVYCAKAVVYRGRTSVGRMRGAAVPNGVHRDLYLGPAPYHQFSLRCFHYGRHFYGWHFSWDMSTAEVGKNGVLLDLISWNAWR
jgi:hypothetical protein